jgi:GH24 family phage-related lysozyme (muramidase)
VNFIVLPPVEHFIHKFETCQLEAYPDKSGRYSIGYGWQGWHGDPIPYKGMVITKPEADDLFRRAIEGFGGEMQKFLRAKKIELENDWQYSALISLAYNKGMTVFAQSEVVIRLMNRDDPLRFKEAQCAFTLRRIEKHPLTGEEVPRLDWSEDEKLGLDANGQPIQRFFPGLHRRRQDEGAIFDSLLDPHRFDA